MAAQRVFGIGELRDNILRYLDERTLLLSQRVNQAFASAIAESSEFQRKLFFIAEGPTSTAGVSDIEVNPLVGKLHTHHHLPDRTRKDTTGRARVELSSKFLEPPTADNKTYHLKHASGSWQRMHLVRPAIRLDLIISFEGSALEGFRVQDSFETVVLRNDPQRPLLDLMDSQQVQHQLRAGGVLTHVKSIATLIHAGVLTPAALADCSKWLLAPESEAAGHRRKFEDLRGLVWNICQNTEWVARANSRARARKYSFRCAVEELEGREGQHYKESDELVRKVGSRPDLLEMDGGYQRLVRWNFACYIRAGAERELISRACSISG